MRHTFQLEDALVVYVVVDVGPLTWQFVPGTNYDHTILDSS